MRSGPRVRPPMYVDASEKRGPRFLLLNTGPGPVNGISRDGLRRAGFDLMMPIMCGCAAARATPSVYQNCRFDEEF